MRYLFFILLLIFIQLSKSHAISPGSQEDLVVNVGDRVFFSKDDYLLDSDAADLLLDQVEFIRLNSIKKIYTLGFGNKDEDLHLFQKRSESVKQFLIDNGVHPYSVISLYSHKFVNDYDENFLIKLNNEDVEALNRTVITLVSKKELSKYDSHVMQLESHVCNLDQPIEFLVEKALNFYNQEKFEDTFICSLAGAYLNDPYSVGILGWHYQFGIGIGVNLSEANLWYLRGVNLGDNYSKVNLAKNLSEGIGIEVDKKEAFELVKEAAETGYDLAEAELAFYYLQSIGTPANYEEAFKYFKLAAEKGNVFAQSYLGWMYAGGRGTELDYEKGFLWTKKAADQNDIFAQANLGWHYHNGFGVEQNYDLAEEFYLKASKQGNEYAKDQLSILKGEFAQKNRNLRDEKKQKQELFEIMQKANPIEEEYIAVKNTNVRKRPSINSDKIDFLNKDSVIYVRGEYNGWYIVDNGKIGFVYSNLLVPKSGKIQAKISNNFELVEVENVTIPNLGTYHALVIGNNKYQHWSRLDSAVNDANKIGQILSSKYNFKVTSLIDANRDEIMNAIFAMRENLKENDNLLIYFAGHGELDEEADRGYWIPVDGDIKNPTKWISNQYIIDQLKASKAKHIMVIADSCFSASLLRGNQEVNTSNSLNQLSKMKTRVILTSGGLGPVFDGGGENNHSVFASVLINALLNQNKPFVTGEIFPQIREYVQNNVDALFVCDDNGNCEEDYQTPEFSVIGKTGHAGGDFIFVPN